HCRPTRHLRPCRTNQPLYAAEITSLPGCSPGGSVHWRCHDYLKRSIGNLAVTDGVDNLLAIIKNRLKRIQYRPDLLDGFLAHTGLALEPGST
ncbi:hypothetical protein, partial [Micromonospora sp. DT229]|uniref:hypothetical protein n=1 Tax=Micromonospora sp. DT229 TaxID=3393430 RepID=UPI003CEB5E9F